MTCGFGRNGPHQWTTKGADRAGRAVRVPYEKLTIEDAPNMPTGDPGLDESQERELSVYHVLDYAGQRSDSGILSGQATAMQPGERTEADRGSTRHHASGRHSDNVMTRTEVRIHAGTEKVASGKARLCKWVETDDVNGKGAGHHGDRPGRGPQGGYRGRGRGDVDLNEVQRNRTG